MKFRRPRTAVKRKERGYALLVVIFLVTLLLISTMAVAPNILTEGRREKEKEMIWRGKQYTRGVKLYYRKLGRFPTSLDDLTKPKIGTIRFMRQAYKDPMNKEDGAWRLIYVGAAGQLIGSLKPQTQNLQFPQIGGAGAPASALNGIATALQPGTPGQSGSSFGQQTSFGQQNMGTTQPGGAATGTNAPGTGSNALGTNGTPAGTGQSGATSGAASDQQEIPSGDTPTIVGGNIIGVGSKINKRSIIVYEKAKNYRLFEFIWDPSKDNVIAGQQGIQTGIGQPAGQSPFGQQPGQSPFGQQPGQNPGNPQQPVQNPQNPPQNPQQNPQQLQ
jgi:hypothetical protein